MNDSILLVEKSDGIVTLTLNRPAAMNALSRALRLRIAETFRELKTDPDAAVVILTGAGRAFSAGLDLKELGDPADRNESRSAIAGADVVEAVRSFPRPVIGAINGFSVTGGFELALACDLLIASSKARFADTHARVGVMPGWGLSQKLARVIGIYRAKELSLTGNYLSAEKAYEWGLVSRVVPPEDLLPTCRAIAQDMMTCVPEVLHGIKKVIDEGYSGTLSDGMALESRVAGQFAASLKPETLAARRADIQARGRKQSS